MSLLDAMYQAFILLAAVFALTAEYFAVFLLPAKIAHEYLDGVFGIDHVIWYMIILILEVFIITTFALYGINS